MTNKYTFKTYVYFILLIKLLYFFISLVSSLFLVKQNLLFRFSNKNNLMILKVIGF